jgi:hypothetical protein
LDGAVYKKPSAGLSRNKNRIALEIVSELTLLATIKPDQV